MSLALGQPGQDSRLDLSILYDQTYRAKIPLSTNTYEQAQNHWFGVGLPTPPRTKEMTGLSVSRNYAHYAAPHEHTNGHASSQHSRVPSDPYITKQANVASYTEPDRVQQSQNNSIATHLQIPESVNSSKGSLAEFAAEITCLFWFESAATLQYAEELPTDALPDRGLVPDATPSLGFRKWVTTMLSTTQVGKNVILLALMFVYRLKKFNPSVSGKRGSEFRLLTIALMLGNKFLDDNTYTNKTWAEVSGISVQEIHIMEVEFLSNMRYELHASQAEWLKWKTLLGKFGSFYEKAARHHAQLSPNSNPPVTPTNQTFAYKLPSPPTKHYNPGPTPHNMLPNPMANLPQPPRSPARHLSHSATHFERKRSIDTSDFLPPAKRLYQAPRTNDMISMAPSLPSGSVPEFNSIMVGEQPLGSRIPQLPMPRIATSTVPEVGDYLAPLSLPTRAMASVYPTTTGGWGQPTTSLSIIPPNLNSQFLPTPFVDGVRPPSMPGSAHTSPIHLYGPSTPTRHGLSPSYFLTNRSSPYRPVRNVHTLLIPPPSAAMQHANRNIALDQMHYQQLGRPVSDRRTGPVPNIPLDVRQHSTLSTPTDLHHRPFPAFN